MILSGSHKNHAPQFRGARSFSIIFRSAVIIIVLEFEELNDLDKQREEVREQSVHLDGGGIYSVEIVTHYKTSLKVKSPEISVDVPDPRLVDKEIRVGILYTVEPGEVNVHLMQEREEPEESPGEL